MLREYAETLRRAVRPHDIIDRYRGEEFALMLPGIDQTAACAVVERCRRTVERQGIEYDGRSIRVTVSVGVAAFGEDGSDPGTLIENADAALYQAKKSGRNRVAATSKAKKERDSAFPASPTTTRSSRDRVNLFPSSAERP